MNNISQKTTNMVQLSLLGAIIILMTFVPFLGYIPLGPIRATLLHIPVIIGSIVLGPKKGAVLGFLFGLTSLFTNTFNPTATSFVFSPFYEIAGMGGSPLSLIICFVPRILIGIVPYYVFRFLSGRLKNETVSLGIAGICGSMVNTILVMNMIYLFFGESYAAARQLDFSTLYTNVILYTIFVNGIMEAIVAAVITAAVSKALLLYNKKFSVRNKSMLRTKA